jgi:hypothetical protein
MKVIFLDFDGVLNSAQYLKSGRHPDACGIGLDPFAVVRLRRLVHETDANIVVTSAWRTGRSIDNLSGLLQAAGCHIEVLDKTADLNTKAHGYKHRGDEINAWLSGTWHKIESFIVIDDDIVDGFSDVQIKTSFDEGLQDNHVDAAIRILNGTTRGTL